MPDDVQNAVDAKNNKTNEFLAKKNVVGVGVGYKNKLGEDTGDPSVVVLVQTKKPAAALTEDDLIPKEVDGVKTDVIEIGFIRAHGLNPRAEFRPVMQPGISIAHYMVGAGTLGAVVRHRDTGERFILSNNHVLANSNDATAGDSILQPGSLDGGSIPGDVVGQLTSFRRLAYIEDAPDDEDTTPDQPDTGTDTPDEGGSGGPAGPSTPTTPDTPTTNPDTDFSFGNAFLDFLVALANLLARWVGSDKRAAVASAAALAAAQAGQITPAQAATVVQAASASRSTSPSGGMSPAEVPFKAQTTLDNLLDAALARPTNPSALSDEILQIGRVTGTKPAALGMTVAKFGRTTSYTEGRITLLDATVNVQYETLAGTKTARFVGQVITTGMSKSGDSGSLIVDPTDKQAVGLLFAGSDLATIFTPIDRVLSYFNVEF